MTTRAFRIVTSAIFMLASAADGLGALTLKTITNPATLTYSPDSIVSGTGNIQVQCGRKFSGNYTIVLAQTSLLPVAVAPAEVVSYGLYKPATTPTYALSLDGTPASANEVLSGYFPPGTPSTTIANIGFAVLVSPLSLPAPGLYTAKINAKLYAGSYPTVGAPVLTKVITVRVRVKSHVDVSVGSTGSSFTITAHEHTIAFNPLRENAQESADFVVRSNIAYKLTLISANGASLITPEDATSLVAYTVTAPDGTDVLANPVASGASATYSAYRSHTVVVTILPFVDLPTMGDYSDTLTVTVTAN